MLACQHYSFLFYDQKIPAARFHTTGVLTYVCASITMLVCHLLRFYLRRTYFRYSAYLVFNQKIPRYTFPHNGGTVHYFTPLRATLLTNSYLF